MRMSYRVAATIARKGDHTEKGNKIYGLHFVKNSDRAIIVKMNIRTSRSLTV